MTRATHAFLSFLAAAAFLALSWAIFRGYLGTDMLLHYVALRWC